MKTKLSKLIAAITVLIFIASIPLAVSAKPGNGNGGPKNAPSFGASKDKGVTQKPVNSAPNTGIKDNKGKQNSKKPLIPKNIWDKQLAGTEKKLADIEKGANDIKTKIDKYAASLSSVSVTPVSTSTSNVSVTGYAYSGNGGKPINFNGFVKGTIGKLKALSNRLSAVDRELKLLEKKVSSDSADKYKALAAKSASIKDAISAQLKRLQAMLLSTTTTTTTTK